MLNFSRSTSSDFTIRSAYGEDTIGACWIPYKGYIISLSTVPSRPEIAIWKDDDDSGDMHIIKDGTAYAVKSAFDYVDRLVPDIGYCSICDSEHDDSCFTGG